MDVTTLTAVRERLYTAVVGDVLDSFGYTHQYLPQEIRPVQPGAELLGRAMPVLFADVFGEQRVPFGRLTEALDALGGGQLFVGRGGRQPCASWGELLTTAARHRGAVGAVLDGFHRDTERLLALGWPVFSRGAYGRDSRVRSVVVDFGVPIEIGGTSVAPGDLVMGDADGVVVIPQAIEDEVLQAALNKVDGEDLVRSAIENGMSTTEAFRRYGIL